MNTTAIAQHLNILDSAIIEVQEWAQVLWVRFVGGCRFVSKKINEAKKMIQTKTPVEHVNAGFRLALEKLSGVEFPEYQTKEVPGGLFLPPTTTYLVGDQEFTYAQVVEAQKQVDWSRVQYVGQKLNMYDENTCDQ